MTGLDDAVARLVALAPPSRAAAAAALLRRVDTPRLRVLVAGEAKRGKSTLVNRLLGRDLLPTGAVPVTAVATTVVPGGPADDELLDVLLLDGRRERRGTADLASLVTERGNPHNVLGVGEVRAHVASVSLPGGVELVDTPGTGSVWEHNTEAARAAYATLDAVVVVLTADPPVSAADRALLASLPSTALRTFVLVNKLDQVLAADRDEVEAFTREVCRGAGVSDEQVWFGSARQQDGGFEAFRRSFVRYLDERSRADAHRAIVGHALRLQRVLTQDLDLELVVLDVAAADGEARVDALAARVAGLADDATRLDDECASVERALRRELDSSAAALTASLMAGLASEVASCGTAEDGRRLVSERTTPAVGAWRRAQHTAFEVRLGVLRRLVDDQVADQLARMSSDALELLGVRLDHEPPEFALAPPPPLVLDYEPGARWEGPTASLLGEHTPGAVRRARRRLLEDLPGLVDRQVGRTRAELQRQLAEAVRLLRSRLRTEHRDRLDELVTVLAAARTAASVTVEVAAGRRTALDGRLAALAEVGQELAGALGSSAPSGAPAAAVAPPGHGPARA